MLSEVSAGDAKNIISLCGDQHLTEQMQQVPERKCIVRLKTTCSSMCLTLLGEKLLPSQAFAARQA